MDLRECLNDSQYEAVTTLQGPLLVIAGAGSGKTRVIEYRSFELVRGGVNPSSILLMTFTRRAAREMIARASRQDPRCKDIDGGTFHSFAYRMLKRYARAIGFNQELIALDESDAQEALHRCATALNLYGKDKRFPKKDTLRSIISMAINKASPIGEIIKKEYPHFLEYVEDVNRLAMVYAEYKIKRGYIDYDDMLIYLKAMLENEDIHRAVTKRYRHVMIDEYQDTNILQGDIASLIASPTGNIMVVGDDAQSIYGFRGAAHQNILDFPHRFPGCRIIKLEKNYRSTQSILDCANAVLDTMSKKYDKSLSSANNEQGLKPDLLFFKNAYEEAEWIAESIQGSIEEGLALSQVAVLCRSMYLTIPLQAELGKRNIPYDTYGGIRFYEMAHVKDLLCHMKVLVNLKDELAWHRALMLLEGIGAKTSERLTSEIITLASIKDALNLLAKNAGKMRNPVPIKKLLQALEISFQLGHKEVGAIFDVFFEYYRPILKNRFDDWHLRINDLETLRQIAAAYKSMEDMINDFSIEPPERGVWAREPETRDEDRPLTISTIHSAKGLEWERVFVMGLIEGVLPISFSLDSEEELEEEKRLLYVAITRAKRRLFLSMHHQGRKSGIAQFNRLSRFIMPENIQETLNISSTAAKRQDSNYEDYAFAYKVKDDLLQRVLEYYRN